MPAVMRFAFVLPIVQANLTHSGVELCAVAIIVGRRCSRLGRLIVVAYTNATLSAERSLSSTQLVSCANCGRDDTEPVLVKWGMVLVRCRLCRLVYINPRTVTPESDAYFRGPYLETIETDGKLRPGVTSIYSEVLDRLESILFPGKLLDVGCAMGHFMVEARKRSWNAFGVEPCAYAVDYGRNRWGLLSQAVAELRDARLPSDEFDACVMIEVVEHLSDPRGTVREIFRLLKPGGLLYATTPNFDSLRCLLQREHWPPIIPTGHLYYFTAATLGALLCSVGFDSPSNLTPAANLDDEVRALRTTNELHVDSRELERIRAFIAQEDAGKLSNGRGEGLILCASKPFSTRDRVRASLRHPEPLPLLENRLISTANDHRVYLIRGNCKFWVTNVDWLKRRGMRIEDTIQVAPDLPSRFLTGPPLPPD